MCSRRRFYTERMTRNVSLYKECPQNIKNNLYVFRIVSGLGSEESSRLLPEMLRRSYEDILGSSIEFSFAVSASAKNIMNQFVVLDRCVRKTARSLEDCVRVAISIP